MKRASRRVLGSWRRHVSFLAAFALLIQLLGVAGAQEGDTHLTEPISADSPADGGTLNLDSVAAFDPAGGEGVIDPTSTSEERFFYGGVDPTTSELINVTRPQPLAHGAGSIVRFVGTVSPSPSPSGSGATPGAEEPTTSPAGGEPTSGDGETASGSEGEDPEGSTGPTTAEVGPDVCQITFDMSCVQYVQELIGSIGTTDPCDPDNTGQTCQQMVMDALASACDIEKAGAAAGEPSGECIDQLNELVAILIDAACGEGGLPACVGEAQQTLDAVLIIVNAYIDLVYRTACGTDTQTICITKKVALVQGTVNGVIDAVCTDDNSATSNVNECLPMIQEIVDDAVNGACSDSTYGEQGATECVNMAVAIVNQYEETLRQILCQNQSWTACATNKVGDLQALIDSVVHSACDDGVWYTTGHAECVNRINAELVEALDTVYGVMVTVCQSSDGVTCTNNLVIRIGDLIEDACGPIQTSATETSSAGALDHPCEERVLEVVDLVFTTACQSSDAVTCVNNLLDEINETLYYVCTGYRDEYGDGTSACVNKALSVVNSILTTVCQSTNAATCATNLLNTVAELIEEACGSIQTEATTTSSAGVVGHPCEDMVIEIVNFVLLSACNTTDVVACIDSTREELETALFSYYDMVWRTVCPESATDMCIERYRATVEGPIIALVNGIYALACGPDPAETCANNKVQALEAIVLGYYESAWQMVCPESATDMCIERYRGMVEGIVNDIVTTVEGIVVEQLCSDGTISSECVIDVADDVIAVLRPPGLCSTQDVECLLVIEEIVYGQIASLISISCGPGLIGCDRKIGAITTDLTSLTCAPHFLLDCVVALQEAALATIGLYCWIPCNGVDSRIGMIPSLAVSPPEMGAPLIQADDPVGLVPEAAGTLDRYSCYPEGTPIVVTTAPCNPGGDGNEASNAGVESTAPTGGDDCQDERVYDSRTDTTYYVRYGTDDSDQCWGWAGMDIFWMKEGDDKAYGGEGNDIFHMGTDLDEAHGEQGHDVAYGGKFRDILYGGYGKDYLEDNSSNGGDAIGDYDFTYGGPGADFADIQDYDILDFFAPGEGWDRGWDFDCSGYSGDTDSLDESSAEWADPEDYQAC